MSRSKTLFNFIFGGLALVAIVLGVTTIVRAAGLPTSVSGWMWSSDIGWFKIHPTEATVNQTTGLISGYAWSSNIGWLKLDSVGPYPAAPSYGISFKNENATAKTWNVEGWMRACSVFVANCTGVLKPATERGGWDGWIRAQNVVYNYATNKFSSSPLGFAWGDLVTGWTSLAYLQTSPLPSITPTPTVSPTSTVTPTPTATCCGSTPTPTTTVSPTITPTVTPTEPPMSFDVQPGIITINRGISVSETFYIDSNSTSGLTVTVSGDGNFPGGLSSLSVISVTCPASLSGHDYCGKIKTTTSVRQRPNRIYTMTLSGKGVGPDGVEMTKTGSLQVRDNQSGQI